MIQLVYCTERNYSKKGSITSEILGTHGRCDGTQDVWRKSTLFMAEKTIIFWKNVVFKRREQEDIPVGPPYTTLPTPVLFFCIKKCLEEGAAHHPSEHLQLLPIHPNHSHLSRGILLKHIRNKCKWMWNHLQPVHLFPMYSKPREHSKMHRKRLMKAVHITGSVPSPRNTCANTRDISTPRTRCHTYPAPYRGAPRSSGAAGDLCHGACRGIAALRLQET